MNKIRKNFTSADPMGKAAGNQLNFIDERGFEILLSDFKINLCGKNKKQKRNERTINERDDNKR